MTSQIQVVNDALRIIGAARVTGLTGATKSEMLALDAWETVWKTEIEAHAWAFALKRQSIAALSDVPLEPYEYAYALPADCLSVIDIPELHRRQWSMETINDQKAIVTRYTDGGALTLRFITSGVDVSNWPNTFARAVAAKLAMSLCEPITQSNTKLEYASAQYEDAIRVARRTDAIQMPPQEQAVDEWIAARW